MNIRFNLIASKFVYKAIANKFNLAYAALEELEITAIRRNLKDRRSFKTPASSSTTSLVATRSELFIALPILLLFGILMRYMPRK